MYIFLDIDGVLNKEIEWKKMFSLNNECIEAFSDFVKSIKDENCRIILSSSWRTGYSNVGNNAPYIIELQKRLSDYGLQISGKTPVLDNGTREDEVKQYIERYNIKENDYLIIDDDASLYTNKCKKLYLVNSKTGFTKKDMKKIMKIL